MKMKYVIRSVLALILVIFLATPVKADVVSSSSKESNVPAYSEDDLDLLARLIYAEAGCYWIPDWVQRAVGSVVLNRINSPDYPDSMREVIYQPGQYGSAETGVINRAASSKAIKNAKYVLDNGSTLPPGVIGQSGDPFGPVYTSYYDQYLDTTLYFFY